MRMGQSPSLLSLLLVLKWRRILDGQRSRAKYLANPIFIRLNADS